MLKELEDVWPIAVVLCPVVEAWVNDCSDAVVLCPTVLEIWVDVCPVLEAWETDSPGVVVLGSCVLTLVRPLVRLWVVVCTGGVVLCSVLAVSEVLEI